MKHLNTRSVWVHDKMIDKTLKFIKLGTSEHRANIQTKNLDVVRHTQLVGRASHQDRYFTSDATLLFNSIIGVASAKTHWVAPQPKLTETATRGDVNREVSVDSQECRF